MKRTQTNHKQIENFQKIISLLSLRSFLKKKKRVNLYLPEAAIALLDFFAADSSRGEVVTSLVLKEAKRLRKRPPRVSEKIEVSEGKVVKESLWLNFIGAYKGRVKTVAPKTIKGYYQEKYL